MRSSWLVVACAASACTSPAARTAPITPAPGPTSTPPWAPGAFGPKLATAAGSVLMTWLEPKGGDAHRVRFSRFAAGRWTPAVTIAEGTAVFANWADVPVVAEAVDGTLVATWPRRSGDGTYTYDVAIAVSRDGGESWTSAGVAHDDGTESEHGFVSMVPAATGVQAFWLDGRETGKHGHEHDDAGGAMTLRAALIGGGVSQPALLDGRVCDCCNTDAARAAAGAVVAYRDRSDDDVRDIRVVREVGGAWSEPIAVFDDGWQVHGCPVNGPAIAARDDVVVVAWFTLAGDRARVRVAFSHDGGASFGPPVLVDGAQGQRAPLGRVDVALDGDDAIVSWIASDGDDAGIYLRRVSRDGAVGRELHVADTVAERGAGFPQLATIGDQLLVVWTVIGDEAGLLAEQIPVASVAAADSAPAPDGDALVPSRVGDPAPDYSAERLSGGGTSLAGLRGQPVLLNVWATWCEPCRQELPEIDALHERFGPRGLRVVAVSIDGDVDAAALAELARTLHLGIDIWHDPLDLVSSAFGITTVPATFLIDGEGTIVWQANTLVRASDAALIGTIEQLLPAGG